MYFFIYRTTNLVNNKQYLGKHKTNDLDDGYLGSGHLLNKAIKKYGEENFKLEILEFLPNLQTLNARERELITKEIVESEEFYNIKLGGDGGFDHIKRPGGRGNPVSAKKLIEWRMKDAADKKLVYEMNPRLCEWCSEAIPYKKAKKGNKFCCQTCSAYASNVNRPKRT